MDEAYDESIVSRDEIVHLNSGLVTDVNIRSIISSSQGNIKGHINTIVFGHGLGTRNPKLMNKDNDPWSSLFTKDIQRSVFLLSYTARGHGRTGGWQSTADNDPGQFGWDRLSNDMIALANYYNYSTAGVFTVAIVFT